MADDRFKALKSDPRYRLPSKKEARTAVDPRFKTLFTDQEFRKKAAVDRYGRKIKPEANARDLEKLYRLDQDEEDDEDVDVEEEEEKKVEKGKKSKKISPPSDEESEEEDVEEYENEDLEEVATRDPMREGFSASESEEEGESDDEEDDLMDATAGIEQTEEIPMGEVSRRIAAVNLDWDNIRAADLLAVAASFAPPGGKIENVTIYPSEFGRERLEREELEGPPREIFAPSGAAQKSAQKDDEDNEEDSAEESDDYEETKNRLLSGNQATEESEFDTAALRAYQLERLKYYYAVITCSNPQTAKALYDAMDGREYLSSANFFDLRFIPDETSFEEDIPKDECSVLNAGYRPNEFRTEALTHSKVRLTWDDDDATRKEVQKRAFSRAEMDENDLMAYIGSDESDASTKSTKSTTGRGKAGRKEAQRLKMRAALGLADEGEKEKGIKKKGAKDEELGEMQITFTSGLANAGAEPAATKKGVFENEPQDEASTRERYIRKEKERKQARKERAKAARAGGEIKPAEDEEAASADEAKAGDEEDPFADPFFNDPAAATAAATLAARKANKAEKRAKRAAADAEAEGRRAELELLMAGEGDGVTEHFDMREIEKAEKEAKRKNKGKKKNKKDDGKGEVAQADFEIDDKDERFGAVFDSHEYAIDPTNPRFKKTKGMVELLEAGRKKRKQGGDDGEEEEEKVEKRKKKARKEGEGEEENVQNLVARLKGR